MKRIDELFMELPFFGFRQMRNTLRDEGHWVGRGRVRRLMRKMGLMAIYQKPKTSHPHPQHKTYPYLLRHRAFTKPNQVWCAGHHIYPDEARLLVPYRDHGLA